MRHLFFCKLLLSIALFAAAQQAKEQQTITRENLHEMSRKQKTVGSTLLLGGASIVIIGAVIPKGEVIADHPTNRHTYDRLKAILMAAGAVSTIASVPFFIVSKKNRRKAALVGVNIQNTQKLHGRNVVFRSFTAFSVKIGL